MESNKEQCNTDLFKVAHVAMELIQKREEKSGEARSASAVGECIQILDHTFASMS